MPQELAVLQNSDFCTNVRQHREHLLARWTTTEIDNIEQEHEKLIAAYNHEPQLPAALSACDETMTFANSWSIVKGRFKWLMRFCGGLASVFPGTS